MEGCMTQDYKSLVKGLLTNNVSKEILQAVIEGIPLCPEAKVEAATIEAAKRQAPEQWGIAPVYINADGVKKDYSSLSALIKELNLPMSGIQCDPTGKKCKASSAVDILRIAGYTVSGDGEPRKASQGGKILTVYHPDALKEEKEG